jgi:hypothetical protein
MTILSEEAKQNLKNGKKNQKYIFKVENNSLSEYYLLDPFWTLVQKYLTPSWVAPNLLTLLGFIFGLISIVSFILFFPNSKVSIVVSIVGLFLYQTFDGFFYFRLNSRN